MKTRRFFDGGKRAVPRLSAPSVRRILLAPRRSTSKPLPAYYFAYGSNMHCEEMSRSVVGSNVYEATPAAVGISNAPVLLGSIAWSMPQVRNASGNPEGVQVAQGDQARPAYRRP